MTRRRRVRPRLNDTLERMLQSILAAQEGARERPAPASAPRAPRAAEPSKERAAEPPAETAVEPAAKTSAETAPVWHEPFPPPGPTVEDDGDVETAAEPDGGRELVPVPEPRPTPLELAPTGRRAVQLDSLAEFVESHGLGFHLGTAVTRIAEAAERGSDGVDPLREAMWLIARYVAIVEKRPIGADLHAASVRLAGDGEEIAELSRLAAALEQETAVASVPEHPEPADLPERPTHRFTLGDLPD